MATQGIEVQERKRLGYWRRQASTLGATLREAAICLGLAFRTGLAPPLLWRSVLLCAVWGLFWLVVFIYFYDSVGKASLTVAFVLVMGLMLPLGMIPQLVAIPYSSAGGVTAMASPEILFPGVPNLFVNLFNLGSILLYVLALTVMVVFLLWAMATLFSSMIVSRWVLLERTRQRTRDAYPGLPMAALQHAQAAEARPARWWQWLLLAVGLLLPIIGGVLLLGLLCHLVVRLPMQAMVRGVLQDGQAKIVFRECRGVSIVLGVMLLVLAVIPVINLMLPVLLLATGGHVSYRALYRHGARE